jgi:lipoprotein signal peptidase
VQTARGTALNGGAAAGDPDHGAGGPGPAVRPRRLRLLLLIAAVVFVADLASKTIVVATLSHRAPIRLLGGFLTLRELRNSGAAFSIGTSVTVVFTLIALGVIVAILRTARRLRSIPWAVTLGLLLGGAAGNLGDRLLRSPGFLRGHVVDWIQLPHWPVFNVADSCIVCGGILAVLLAARGISIDGTRHAAASPAAGSPAGDRPAGGSPAGGSAAGVGESAPGQAGPRDDQPGPRSALDAPRPVPDRPSPPGLPGGGRP